MRILDAVCNFLAILAGIYLVGIMFGIVTLATLRSFNISAPSHIFTFSEYGLLYIVMAASPWLVRLRGHVFIEMFTAALPAKFGRLFSRGVAVLCVVICLFLVWYSAATTLRAYNFGDADMRSLDMPKWLLLISMPICFGLMALNFLRFVFGPQTLHSGEAGVHE
ncbi:MAG: C4-dicarboxylate ABC transporter permease [Rhodobacteraceae bacterium]|nr:MAG: C4-dicarboxylate ABC transporter permease [Paracoccaceae bacterium]